MKNFLTISFAILFLSGCGTLTRTVEATIKGKDIKCIYGTIGDGEMTIKKTTKWGNK